jgi:CMP-N-acetylneuraminic acid synthetase
MDYKVLAIIPARGGSKGIIKKNLVKLGGKPLVEFSIDVALGCRKIDKIVVSSDDDSVLELAKKHSVDVLKRPKELAGDLTSLKEVIEEVLQHYEGYVLIVLLQPTSPLRTVETVDIAISEFLKNYNEYDSLVPLCKSSTKIGVIKEGKYIANYPIGKQRQELPPTYKECGTVFVFKRAVIEKGGFFGDNIYPFIIEDHAEAIDIDGVDDLELAEFYLKKR